MAEPTVEQNEHPRPRHEERDAKPRAIMTFVIGLAVLTIVALLAMWGLFDYLGARQAKTQAPASPLAETRRVPPPPHLQVEPKLDLEHLRAAEDDKLNQYGWVNRQAGVVRVPIERAMELVAERGLPVRAEKPETRNQKPESQRDQELRIKPGGSRQ